nr:unnamed protein product [Callosobruchus analis]
MKRKMSLSIWYGPIRTTCVARHGEKSSVACPTVRPQNPPPQTPQRPQQPNPVGYPMEKLMDIAEDLDTLVCVNPHHVNPVMAGGCAKDTMTNSSHKWGVLPPQVKLEMEEFRDLSSFVEPRRSLINTADELNTPTFDKDVFDFDIFTSSSSRHSSMTQEEEEAKDLPNEDLLIKLEGEALYSATNSHQHHQQTMLMNSNIFTMDVTSYIAGATTNTTITTDTGSGSGPPSPAGTATERIEIIPMSALAVPAAAEGGGTTASYHLQQCDRVVYPKDNRSPLSVDTFASSRTATAEARQQKRPR